MNESQLKRVEEIRKLRFNDIITASYIKVELLEIIDQLTAENEALRNNGEPIHHPWCNKQRGPLSECNFCSPEKSDFFGKYPWKPGDSYDELHKTHFPDAVVVGQTNQREDGKE